MKADGLAAFASKDAHPESCYAAAKFHETWLDDGEPIQAECGCVAAFQCAARWLPQAHGALGD